jgi:hypothetical protein
MEKRTSTQPSTLNLSLVHKRQEFEFVTVAGPFAYLPLLFKYVVPMGHPSPGETGHERPDSSFRVRLTLVASINPEYDAFVLIMDRCSIDF